MLFDTGEFTSHSGLTLSFKINCDALNSLDWDCVAKLVASRYHYREAFGVPRGGLAFAEALNKRRDFESWQVLVVDDVLTTGASMDEVRQRLVDQKKARHDDVVGVVLFSRKRSPGPLWVKPVFRMTEQFL